MKVVEVRNGFNDFHFNICLLIFERSDRYFLNTGPLNIFQERIRAIQRIPSTMRAIRHQVVVSQA